jgi:hypothetical protein
MGRPGLVVGVRLSPQCLRCRHGSRFLPGGRRTHPGSTHIASVDGMLWPMFYREGSASLEDFDTAFVPFPGFEDSNV